jgi:Uma2 family endonuclease
MKIAEIVSTKLSSQISKEAHKSKVKHYTLRDYETVIEKIEQNAFEYVNGMIYWRYSQKILPAVIVDFILDNKYDEDIFSQLLAHYELMGHTKNHSKIAANLNMELAKQLDSEDFLVRMEDPKLEIPDKKKSRIADIVISSSKHELFTKNHRLQNPLVLIEIASPATSEVDKTDKLKEYRSIESLQEYIMVEQEQISIEQYIRKAENKWETDTLNSGNLVLPSVKAKIAVDKIYRGVEIKK